MQSGPAVEVRELGVTLAFKALEPGVCLGAFSGG